MDEEMDFACDLDETSSSIKVEMNEDINEADSESEPGPSQDVIIKQEVIECQLYSEPDYTTDEDELVDTSMAGDDFNSSDDEGEEDDGDDDEDEEQDDDLEEQPLPSRNLITNELSRSFSRSSSSNIAGTQRKKVAAALLLLLLIRKRKIKKQKKTTRRSCWIKPRIEKTGETLNIDGKHFSNQKLLDAKNMFSNCLAMSPDKFDYLLSLVSDKIAKTNTVMREAISAEKRLAITLRYLATGDSFTVVGEDTGIASSTVSVILSQVCKAIYSTLHTKYLKVPKHKDDWLEIAREFRDDSRFPHCLGILQGKHVTFLAPTAAGLSYRNFSNIDSVVFMAITDAKYSFRYVDVGSSSHITDGGDFEDTAISHYMRNETELPSSSSLSSTENDVPFVLLADDTFPSSQLVLTPYPKDIVNEDTKIFNYRHERCMRTGENAFGILSNRFRFLLKRSSLSIDKLKLLIQASVVLHNFLIQECEEEYLNICDVEDPENETFHPGEWRVDNNLDFIQLKKAEISPTAAIMRDSFNRFFNQLESREIKVEIKEEIIDGDI